MAAHNLPGRLVMEVPPLVAHFAVGPGDQELGTVPAPAAALLAGQRLLPIGQHRLAVTKEAGVGDVLARGQRGKVFQPHVEANSGAIRERGLRYIHDTCEADVPLVGAPALPSE